MYVDKLDGVVDTAFFEKMSTRWRDEQSRCLREIERHQHADRSYMDRGRAASRTSAERAKAVRAARTARETRPVALRTIELHLGRG
jgi:hypothetical protein